MARRALVLAVLAMLNACAAYDRHVLEQVRESERNRIAQLQATVAKTDLNREITMDGADAIAQLYYHRYIRIEGAAGPVQDNGTSWYSTVYVGVAAIPYGSILIEKAGGKVSSSMGPTLANVRDLLTNEP